MGKADGNPTNKECEGALRPESFKQKVSDPAIIFSSTGKTRRTEPTYVKWPYYNFYANLVTTSVANPCAGRYGDKEWGKYLAT